MNTLSSQVKEAFLQAWGIQKPKDCDSEVCLVFSQGIQAAKKILTNRSAQASNDTIQTSVELLTSRIVYSPNPIDFNTRKLGLESANQVLFSDNVPFDIKSRFLQWFIHEISQNHQDRIEKDQTVPFQSALIQYIQLILRRWILANKENNDLKLFYIRAAQNQIAPAPELVEYRKYFS